MILISYIIINLISYDYLKNIKLFSYKDCKSILIVNNSFIITLGCLLNLYDYIEEYNLYKFYYFTLSFYLSDLYIMYGNENKSIYKSKIIHHIISIYGILNYYKDYKLISTLYITEIINLPLELRFACIRYNYKKYYLEWILTVLTYILFFIMRIINGYYTSYEIIFINENFNKCDYLFILAIYIYWNYLFYLINKKLFKIIYNSIY